MKKKFFGLLVMSLLVLFLGLYSTSYAMSKSEAFEYCKDNCGYASMFNSTGASSSATSLNYTDFLTYLDNKDKDVFFVKRQNNDNTFEIYYYDILQINDNVYTATLNSNGYSDTKRTSSFNNKYNINSHTQSSGSSNLSLPTGRKQFLYGIC